MRIVVVGGSASKVGKTALACSLIAQARRRGRVVALKISTHPHRRCHALWCYARASRHSTTHDTDRYLAAGADTALLLEAGSEFFRSHLASGLRGARRLQPQTLIIESTTAGAMLAIEHDSWFVAATAPWKPRADRHFARAQHIVRPHELANISLLLEPFEHSSTFEAPRHGSPSFGIA